MFTGGAFTLGFWARGKLEQLSLPQVRLGTGSSSSSEGFRLVVRVHEAAIPALASPGIVTTSRPRLEVQVGDATKSTELADFSNSGSFPWRFGDTLTFPMALKDLSTTGGLQLRLLGHSEARLGPVSLNFRNAQDLAEAKVDLCRRVLPACVKNAESNWGEEDTAPIWSSPRIPFPLLPPAGTIQSSVAVPEGAPSSHPQAVPEAAAHCVLSFEVSSDPEVLLAAVAERDMPLAEKVERQVERNADNVFRWMHEPVETDAFERLALAAYDVAEKKLGFNSARGDPPASGDAGGAEEILAPDEQPDGWVWHRSADGRVFWHHTALGPPPWEILGKLPGDASALSTSEPSQSVAMPAEPPKVPEERKKVLSTSLSQNQATGSEAPPPPPLHPPPPESHARKNYYQPESYQPARFGSK